ncbi:hypothetical protein QR680_005146 [Steinernema hermaphroditum]|uniref:UDP-galactose transporter n=1 Tax=Steinernema hermaphroditum TaxID=289476 RepID=A0AA39HT67_9BILA|nr:hypothetical protein QR680_005146 [Steinernema hermaphroditum]
MNDERLWKYGGLLLLTLQQASMPLMVKYSRNREENEVFITTVNVFFMEVIKITFCSTILIHNARSVKKFAIQIYEAMTDWMETAKVCLPALIYTLQNNLYYVALSNLEPTTFCAFYQLKILTTALMFRFLLNRPLTSTQWMALLVLVVGVTDVQMQYQPPSSGRVVENSTLGFVCVIAMCFTSAFAGVYLEKVLKGSEANVFVQNVRIASVGLIVSGISMLYNDSETIGRDGLFRGFDALVWVMTTTNSVGGLLIAVVMKYADNILKIYAQSAAIIGAAVGSWLLFDFSPNLLFSGGVLLVMISMYLYSKYPHRPRVEKTPLLEEQQLASKPKDIPYLNTSIQEQREQRLLQEAMRVENLADEKLRMVPNSLKLNTGRSSRD